MQQYIWRLVALALILSFTPARADQVSDASRGVVRVIALGEDSEGRQVATGSGFAISSTHIVTNAHVVQIARDSIGDYGVGIVPSQGGALRRAHIIAYERDKDLAILEIEGGDVQPLSLFGGSFREGQPIVALGYPANVDEITMDSQSEIFDPRAPVRSGGNFSNMRTVHGTEAMLHTASIAHGNSGGPLIDSCGRVLGVNTFVTSNDRGDSSFGFAISTGELTAFLRRNGQRFASVSAECVPPEVAASRAEAEKAHTELEAERAAGQALRTQQAAKDEVLAKAQLSLQAGRENHLAGAALALVAAALMAALAWSWRTGGNALRTRWAGAGAALLFMTAMAAFFSRPTSLATDATTADPAPQIALATAPTGGEPQIASPSAQRSRALICAINLDDSQVSTSSTDDVSLSFAPSGCINQRTQYAPGGSGVWQRVSVPNQEEAISRQSFDAKTLIFTRERWLPDADIMTHARKVRDSALPHECTRDRKQIENLASAQKTLILDLSAEPDERMVYRCRDVKPG
jgi:Trypsin-like peptidase domain